MIDAILPSCIRHTYALPFAFRGKTPQIYARAIISAMPLDMHMCRIYSLTMPANQRIVKSLRVVVLVTPKERKMWGRAAKRSGHNSLAEYVRNMVNRNIPYPTDNGEKSNNA